LGIDEAAKSAGKTLVSELLPARQSFGGGRQPEPGKGVDPE